MPFAADPFFGLNVATPLVRRGEDERLARDPETGADRHTLVPVYCEMLVQIARDYPGLPDPRTMTLTEIRFFYEALRGELKRHTKPGRRDAPRFPRAPRRARKR